jgi:hypothetical protein
VESGVSVVVVVSPDADAGGSRSPDEDAFVGRADDQTELDDCEVAMAWFKAPRRALDDDFGDEFSLAVPDWDGELVIYVLVVLVLRELLAAAGNV